MLDYDGERVTFDVEGDTAWGAPGILLDQIERTVEGARVNGIVFTVPSGVGATHPIALERPDPGPNEVLVFWPCLIHGGAYNQQPDRTRVSLEMRFWRVA